MMFFGVTSVRNSGGSCCRRQRLRMATATAFLAAPWPTMYLSSSATTWRGVRSGMRTFRYLLIDDFDLEVAIRVDAQIRRDAEGRFGDLAGVAGRMQRQ